jgi:hypothetical protein
MGDLIAWICLGGDGEFTGSGDKTLFGDTVDDVGWILYGLWVSVADFVDSRGYSWVLAVDNPVDDEARALNPVIHRVQTLQLIF